MRNSAFAITVLVAAFVSTPSFAMTVPNLDAATSKPIVLASGPCALGYNFDAYRGKCRSARFGFGRSYYPGGRCIIRPTPYGPKRFCG